MSFEDTFGDENRCPENATGHEADLSSAHIERDGDSLYVDVECRHCGRSGCIAVIKADESGKVKVDW